MTDKTNCLLCDAQATVVYRQHPGYREGSAFDIAHCPACRTAFVLPLEVDESIYELIYSKIKDVPGYCRYEEHMRAVSGSKQPIEYLIRAEESYWAIVKALQAGDKQHSAVLEIGSGLGYLTHALRSAGYDASGLELSSEAVKQASARFGPWYRNGTLDELSGESKRYDYIVLSQVIEHVPDITALLRGAGKLLAEGGKIVMTTPNRSLFDEGVVWETELPPVHLWWFSEQSITVLGQKLGFEVGFVDFSDFYRTTFRAMPGPPTGKPTRSPILKQNGDITPPTSRRLRGVAKRIVAGLGLEPAVRHLIAGGAGSRISGARGTDICAVLTRSPCAPV